MRSGLGRHILEYIFSIFNDAYICHTYFGIEMLKIYCEYMAIYLIINNCYALLLVLESIHRSQHQFPHRLLPLQHPLQHLLQHHHHHRFLPHLRLQRRHLPLIPEI